MAVAQNQVQNHETLAQPAFFEFPVLQALSQRITIHPVARKKEFCSSYPKRLSLSPFYE